MSIQPQYYKKIIFYILFFTSLIICSPIYISNWGSYSITNNSLSISSDEIVPVINSHIDNMNLIFGPIPKAAFKIIIKSDNTKYSNTFNWSLGITQGNKIIIKDPSISHIKKDRFYEVLKHELNHIYLNRISKKRNLPRWFKEGFCMYYANESSLRNKLILGNEINNKEWFDLKSIDRKFQSNSKKQFNFAYAYSQATVQNMIDLYGEKSIQDIISYIKKDYFFDEAFNLYTSITINSYSQHIYTNIYSRYRWFNLIKFPNFLLVLAPLLLTIIFVMKKIRNQKIIKKWEIEEELEQNNLDNN